MWRASCGPRPACLTNALPVTNRQISEILPGFLKGNTGHLKNACRWFSLDWCQSRCAAVSEMRRPMLISTFRFHHVSFTLDHLAGPLGLLSAHTSYLLHRSDMKYFFPQPCIMSVLCRLQLKEFWTSTGFWKRLFSDLLSSSHWRRLSLQEIVWIQFDIAQPTFLWDYHALQIHFKKGFMLAWSVSAFLTAEPDRFVLYNVTFQRQSSLHATFSLNILYFPPPLEVQSLISLILSTNLSFSCHPSNLQEHLNVVIIHCLLSAIQAKLHLTVDFSQMRLDEDNWLSKTVILKSKVILNII